MKHKYYDVIVAFANGEAIQYKSAGEGWVGWEDDFFPAFYTFSHVEWRIKPKKKVKWVRLYRTPAGSVLTYARDTNEWKDSLLSNGDRWIIDPVAIEYEE